METTGIKGFWNGLPSWSKGVIAIVGVGGTIFLSYKLYKAIQQTSEEKKDKELTSEIDGEIKKFIAKGLKQSFNSSQYLQFAQTIHQSIKVCAGDDYGTAEDVLKKMKNDLDVALLIKAFGKRQDYCFGVPLAEMALFAYLNKELGNEWAGITSYRIDSINKDWKKKGITYQI